MNIEDIKKVGMLYEIINSSSGSVESNIGSVKSSPFKVGKHYFIRTVTMIQVGRLVEVYDTELVLEDASWVADTGRFHLALKNGLTTLDNSEIERFNTPVIVGRGAIIDACEYLHDLPVETK